LEVVVGELGLAVALELGLAVYIDGAESIDGGEEIDDGWSADLRTSFHHFYLWDGITEVLLAVSPSHPHL